MALQHCSQYIHSTNCAKWTQEKAGMGIHVSARDFRLWNHRSCMFLRAEHLIEMCGSLWSTLKALSHLLRLSLAFSLLYQIIFKNYAPRFVLPVIQFFNSVSHPYWPSVFISDSVYISNTPIETFFSISEECGYRAM